MLANNSAKDHASDIDGLILEKLNETFKVILRRSILNHTTAAGGIGQRTLASLALLVADVDASKCLSKSVELKERKIKVHP